MANDQQLLFQAISSNSEQTVKRILISGQYDVNVNQVFSTNGPKPLELAVMRQNESIAELLIENKADAHAVNMDDDNYLHYAARLGNVSLVRLFLRQRIDVNAKNFLGHTPLHVAVTNNRIDVAQFLLANNAATDTRCKFYKNCPLLQAVANRNVRLVRLLLHCGADPNLANSEGYTPFFANFEYNPDDCDLFDRFVECGASMHIEPEPGIKVNALHVAAAGGSLEMLQKLLSLRKIDVNEASTVNAAPDTSGLTALHSAIAIMPRDHSEDVVLAKVRLLVEHGASVDTVTYNRKSPLSTAALTKRLKVVQYLLDAGLDVDGGGKSLPIFAAVESNDIATVEFMIERGARLDLVDPWGDNLLFHAVRCAKSRDSRRGMVDYLLARGLDLGYRNELTGTRILQCALQSGDGELYDYLTEDKGVGIEVFAKNESKESLLFSAAASNLYCVASELVSIGSVVDEKNGEGVSILAVAVSTGNLSLVELLIENGATVAEDEIALANSARTKDHEMFALVRSHGAVYEPGTATGRKMFFDAIKHKNYELLVRLIRLGADVNWRDGDGNLPVGIALKSQHTRANALVHAVLVQHIALLRFQKKSVEAGLGNIIVQNKRLLWYYQHSRDKLKTMKSCRITEHCDVTLYDLLTKRNDALIRLLDDNDLRILLSFRPNIFFHLDCNEKCFYCKAIDYNLFLAAERLQSVTQFKNILVNVFGNIFPDSVIDKISKY